MLQYKPICALCTQYYTDPRILQCGHTFCYQCLLRLYNSGQQSVTCPVCCWQHYFEHGSIDCLAHNYDLARCVDAYKSNNDTAHQTDCDTNNKKCLSHKDCDLAFYCTSCKQTACRKCVVLGADHSTHAMVDLDTGLKLITELYQQLLQSATDLLGSCVDKSLTRRQYLRQLQLGVAVAVDKVNKQVNTMVSQLETVRFQMIVRIQITASKCASAVCSRVDLLKLRKLKHLTTVSTEQLKLAINQQRLEVLTSDFAHNVAESERQQQLHSDVLVHVQNASGSLAVTELSDKLDLVCKDVKELSDRAAKLTRIDATSDDVHMLLCLGGTSNPNSARLYNPVNNKWHDVKRMTEEHHSAAAATRGNKVVITGGAYYLNSVEQYDPETDTWTRLSDLIYGRYYHALVNLEGGLYCIGGITKGNNCASNSVETLAADGDSWLAGPAMSVARYGHAVALVFDGIVVAGGHDQQNRSFNGCELYNRLTSRWTSIANMLKPRAYAAAASHNNTMYVFGGFKDLNTYYDDVEQYDAVGNTWTVLPTQLRCAKRYLAAACVNGHIYLVGGRKGTEALRECERFNVSTGKFTSIEPQPEANCTSTVVCVRMSRALSYNR